MREEPPPSYRRKELPDAGSLREALTYIPENGAFYWKTRSDVGRVWNSRYAGKRAFYTKNRFGYLAGYINGKPYLAHRVAWKIYYGTEPSEIDHINGDKADNRIVNLREVTRSENCRNKSRRSDNTSGIVGISKSGRYWRVRIHHDGQEKYLGSFHVLDDAVAAWREAAKAFGYHQNHGRG